MKALTLFPSADPGTAGPAAARFGNVFALRVAADRERDAGRDADAAKLALLAGELEVRCVQARQLRAVLSAIPIPAPVLPEGTRPQLTDVRAFANRHGLQVEPAMLSRSKVLRCAFVLLHPTDGENDADTADRLAEVFGRAFPRALFLVYAVNLPLTEAGREADELLDRLDQDGRAAA